MIVSLFTHGGRDKEPSHLSNSHLFVKNMLVVLLSVKIDKGGLVEHIKRQTQPCFLSEGLS